MYRVCTSHRTPGKSSTFPSLKSERIWKVTGDWFIITLRTKKKEVLLLKNGFLVILKINSQSNVQGNIPKKYCVYLQNFLSLQQSFTRSVVQLICRSFFKVVHWSMAYFIKRKVSQQIQINDKKHAMKYITIKFYLFATDKKTIQEKTISFSVPFVWMNLTKGSLCESKN